MTVQAHSATRLLLLDRDGVINKDSGYVGHQHKFEFLPGIIDVIKAFVNQGYLPVVVTNQSGIARGYYTQAEFLQLTRWMQKTLCEQGLPHIPVYHCPHHPDAAERHYRKQCDCRKPAPGMLKNAAHDLQASLPQSVMIGDSWRDMQAGARAGVKTLCYINNQAAPDDEETADCSLFTTSTVAQLLPLCSKIIAQSKSGSDV